MAQRFEWYQSGHSVAWALLLSRPRWFIPNRHKASTFSAAPSASLQQGSPCTQGTLQMEHPLPSSGAFPGLTPALPSPPTGSLFLSFVDFSDSRAAPFGRAGIQPGIEQAGIPCADALPVSPFCTLVSAFENKDVNHHSHVRTHTDSCSAWQTRKLCGNHNYCDSLLELSPDLETHQPN